MAFMGYHDFGEAEIEKLLALYQRPTPQLPPMPAELPPRSGPLGMGGFPSGGASPQLLKPYKNPAWSRAAGGPTPTPPGPPGLMGMGGFPTGGGSPVIFKPYTPKPSSLPVSPDWEYLNQLLRKYTTDADMEMPSIPEPTVNSGIGVGSKVLDAVKPYAAQVPDMLDRAFNPKPETISDIAPIAAAQTLPRAAWNSYQKYIGQPFADMMKTPPEWQGKPPVAEAVAPSPNSPESRVSTGSARAVTQQELRRREADRYMELSGMNDMVDFPGTLTRRGEQIPRPDLTVPGAAEVAEPDYGSMNQDIEAAMPKAPAGIDPAIYAILGALGQLGSTPDANAGQLLGALGGGAARGALGGMEKKAASDERYQERLANYYLQTAQVKGGQAEGKAARQSTRYERGRNVQVEENAETQARVTDQNNRRNRAAEEDLVYYDAALKSSTANNNAALQKGRLNLQYANLLQKGQSGPADTALLGRLATEIAKGKVAMPDMDVVGLRGSAEAVVNEYAKANPQFDSAAREKLIEQLMAQKVLERLHGNPEALRMARGVYPRGLGVSSPAADDDLME